MFINKIMAFREPLTTEELHEIGVRKDGADVVRLLWEIKRLRAMLLSTNQVLRDIEPQLGPLGIVLKCLKDRLVVEPVIMEMEKLRVDTKRKPGC